MSDTGGAGGRPRWTPLQPEAAQQPADAKGSGAVQLGSLTRASEPSDPAPPPREPAPEPPPAGRADHPLQEIAPEPGAPPAPARSASIVAPDPLPRSDQAAAPDTGAEPVPASALAPAVVAEPGPSPVSLDKSRAWPVEPAPGSPPVQPPFDHAPASSAPPHHAAAEPGAESAALRPAQPDPFPTESHRAADDGRSGRERPSIDAPESRADPYEAPPERPSVGSPLAGVDPRNAPPERRGNRGLLIGGAVAAAAVAALAAVALMDGGGRDRADAPAPRASGPSAPGAEAAAAGEPFTPPDREAVRDAYAEVGRVYRTAGVSGLADVGRRCFTELAERPTYRGLDYCSALDAFGAAFAHRVSGSPAPADSWFGQTESRFLRTAATVLGPDGDPAARLVDIRRLAIEVAREGGPAFAAAAPATSAPTEPEGSVQVQTVEPAAPRAPDPGPALAQAPARRPDPAPSPPPTTARREPPPAPVPVDRETYAGARQEDFGPTAAEVAAARPREGRGPSFNCRSARTESERLVCAEPELAQLDRRLNAAYEDAIAAGADRRSLRREQDQWLGVRERAAPDPDAVADTYRRRIRELESLR